MTNSLNCFAFTCHFVFNQLCSTNLAILIFNFNINCDVREKLVFICLVFYSNWCERARGSIFKFPWRNFEGGFSILALFIYDISLLPLLFLFSFFAPLIIFFSLFLPYVLLDSSHFHFTIFFCFVRAKTSRYN